MAVVDKLTKSIQSAREESADGWGLPDVSDEYVSAEFFGHLKQAREAWAKWQPRLIEGTLTMETEEEAIARVEAARERRLRTVKSTTAKKRVSLKLFLTLLYLNKNRNSPGA